MKKRLLWMAATAPAVAALACVPTLPKDPVPEAMEFDPQSFPPRVAQPTDLVIDAMGHIDFSLAGLTLPADCASQTTLSPAECEFDQYLQTLDGFPTLTPAQAPVTAPLDPSTFTPESGNVVVFAHKAQQPVSDLQIGFQPTGDYLTLRPKHWAVNEFYWAAVRGYANGVKAVGGAEVVGVPAQFLLKQETSLTCGATTADNIDPTCPAFALLSQQPVPGAAQTPSQLEAIRRSLLQLEAIRQSLQDRHAWEDIAAAGIPKDEVAVIWGFPTHSNSVAELDPSPAAMIVPQLTMQNQQIKVAVQGPVDPASVTPFIRGQQNGSVLVMDLTAAAANDLVDGLPPVTATFADGTIVITGAAAFQTGHQIGLFFTSAIHDAPGDAGRPLVSSPVSKLLTLRAPLLGANNRSALSSVSDADAQLLEAGRQQLAVLFDNPTFAQLTGVSRDTLVYCFAFQVGAP